MADNDKPVRSFIPFGAPFPNKTTNFGFVASVAYCGCNSGPWARQHGPQRFVKRARDIAALYRRRSFQQASPELRTDRLRLGFGKGAAEKGMIRSLFTSGIVVGCVCVEILS
jgi:hypothetical protein